MRKIVIFIMLVVHILAGSAQNPFASYGYQPKMATLSNGRFDEFHDKSWIVEIGSVKFDTKTNKIVGLAEKDTVVNTLEVQTVSRFISIDPEAERYYSISPYAYCANNPIRFVDPDGKDIVIWYNDNRDKFIFNGTNQSSAPNDPFVQSVIAAYDYDVDNGGGNNLKKIATNSKYKVGIAETEIDSEPTLNGVFFNPTGGLKLEDGYVLSPATILEHEFGHIVARKEGTNDISPDSQYDTAVERKIILGEELVTAKANGELLKSHKGRKSHNGNTHIIVRNSTSTQEVSKQASDNYGKRIDKVRKERAISWTSEY